MKTSYRLYDVVADQMENESFPSLEEATKAKGRHGRFEVHEQQHTDKCVGGGDKAGACQSITVVFADESAYVRARQLGRDI